jgi:hypothetical protein
MHAIFLRNGSASSNSKLLSEPTSCCLSLQATSNWVSAAAGH